MSKLKIAALAALVASVVGGGVWVVWASPWLRVETVSVRIINESGVHWRDPTLQARVTEALPTLSGRPLAHVDGAAIAGTLRKVRGVSDAEVRRGWPNTVAVLIHPRKPVAVFAAQRAGGVIWQLVDQQAVVVDERSTAPTGWVVLSISPGSRGGRASMAVWAGLPPKIRARVSAMTTRNPASDASVEFTLASGARVVWGDSSNGARKAQVLQALLKYPARVYDVSAPDVPTTTK
jgi:cell division protein FtsQ